MSSSADYIRADLRINTTESATYECIAQNEHIEGRARVTVSATIYVVGVCQCQLLQFCLITNYSFLFNQQLLSVMDK
jgi:hypothetical protein